MARVEWFVEKKKKRSVDKVNYQKIVFLFFENRMYVKKKKKREN